MAATSYMQSISSACRDKLVKRLL